MERVVPDADVNIIAALHSCSLAHHIIELEFNCCSCGNIHVHKSFLTQIQLRRTKQLQHRWRKCHRQWSGLNYQVN